MATIYNSDLIKEIVDAGKLQTARDSVPIQLADKVIPVMEVNPKLLRRLNIIRSGDAVNATTATIYTTPSDRDFYIVAMALSCFKNATSTSLNSRILATIDGTSCNLLRVMTNTLTAERADTAISLPFPVKIDRNTNITVTNQTDVASIFTCGIIYGYTVENTRA